MAFYEGQSGKLHYAQSPKSDNEIQQESRERFKIFFKALEQKQRKIK